MGRCGVPHRRYKGEDGLRAARYPAAMIRLLLLVLAAVLLALSPVRADDAVVYSAEGTDVRFTLPPGTCRADGDAPAEARLRTGAQSSTGARRLALLFLPCAERERLRGDAAARPQAYGHVGLFGTPAEADRRYAPLPSAPELKSKEWLETRLALLNVAMRAAGDEPAATLPADETGTHLLILRKDGGNRLSVELRSISEIGGFVFHIREFIPTAEPAALFAVMNARRDWIRSLQDLNAES